eukprot:scaffold66050_cov27-Prasinocladus_malaysianus.AAC.2
MRPWSTVVPRSGWTRGDSLLIFEFRGSTSVTRPRPWVCSMRVRVIRVPAIRRVSGGFVPGGYPTRPDPALSNLLGTGIPK